MKKLLLCALVVLCGTLAWAGWTKQNSRVERIQADTTFAADGSATSVKVTAFLVSLLTNDDDSTQTRGRNDWTPVAFDLLSAPVSTTQYTAAGKTVNGVQLAALLRQVALDEATRQNISP